MSRTVFAVALAILAALGFAARLAPLDERRLDPGSRELGGARWLVDDAGTALHLRRIELALAEGRVPQHDPFLAHGTVVEIPALPVYDALLAGFAQRWLAHQDGDPSLGGVDEADLEAFAAWVGPVAYLIGFAALAWAAWIGTRGAYAPVLTAAAIFALAPAAITASEVGRLDAGAFALVLLALLVRGTQVAMRADDSLTSILEALLCGVIAGLLTAMSAAGPFLALPTAAAFLVRATRGPTEVRPIAVRAGLLYALVAAFVARLPLADGPWEQLPEGLVARWSLAASDALLVSAAPFAVLLLTAPRDAAHRTRAFARIAMLAAMLALLVFELPRAWNAASGPIRAWWDAGTFLGTRVDPGRAVQAAILVCAGAGYPLVRAWKQRDGASVHLATLAPASIALVLVEPATGVLCVGACACAVAGAIAALHGERGRIVWLAVVVALAAAASCIVHAIDDVSDGARARDARREAFASLRWIRENVPAGGPFNSSSARASWGILADPAVGELVAYHARRPVFSSRSATFAQLERARDARRLADSTNGAETVARMHAHGLGLAFAAPALARGSGLLGSSGVGALLRGDDPLPGTVRLLPAVVPRPDEYDLVFLPDLAAVWSLDGPPPPREPSLVAPR